MTDKTDMLLAEYAALRSELNRRSTVRYQIILGLLVWATAVAGIMEGPKAISTFLFLFPLIATLFAPIWVYNYKRTMQISGYMRTQIENNFLQKGWETTLYEIATRKTPIKPLASAIVAARFFIFLEIVSTTVGAIILIYNELYKPSDVFWLTPLIIGVIFTSIFFTKARDFDKRDPP